MFNEVCVSSAYAFVSKKLRVNYGIFDMYRMTTGVVSVAVAIYIYIYAHAFRSLNYAHAVFFLQPRRERTFFAYLIDIISLF